MAVAQRLTNKPARPLSGRFRNNLTKCLASAQKYSNPIGVHALVWAGGWTKEECQFAITSSLECGYDFIEIPVFNPERMDSKFTRSQLIEYGLQASCSLGLTPDADISNESQECAAKGLAKLVSALQFTSDIGGKHMCGVIHSALAKYPAPTTMQGRRNCVSCLKTLARRANDLGVTLGLEVVNRYETNLLNTAAQAVELLHDIDEDNVKVHLDTYHMHIEENGMDEAVRLCGQHLGYVHIGESHRGYLGTGNVDFNTFFSALMSTGYEGPITFESFSSAVVSPDLSNNLCVWRNLWDSSRDLAVEARQYIHVGLSAAERKFN